MPVLSFLDPGRANADIRKVGGSMPGSRQRFQTRAADGRRSRRPLENGCARAAAEDARSVVRVVELRAEDPLRPETAREHFGGQQHAKWRSREIDPEPG